MRIVALGRTKLLFDTIRLLHQAGHEISGIATCRAAPEYSHTEADFQELAAAIGCEFMLTQSLNRPEAIKILTEWNADVAVSVNWVNLIGEATFNSFKHGILNAHAGDLPRYRGNAVQAWAILNGEERVGLCIHAMDPLELDSGPIYRRAYYPLTSRTYIGDVFEWLEEVTPKLFMETVELLESGRARPEPQHDDPAAALRCYPRLPQDARLEWRLPADHLDRLVRASSSPFGGSFTFFNGERLVVWRAHSHPWRYPSLAVPGQVVGRDPGTGTVTIATGDGTLVLEQVQAENDKPRRPVDVIKSMRARLE